MIEVRLPSVQRVIPFALIGKTDDEPVVSGDPRPHGRADSFPVNLTRRTAEGGKRPRRVRTYEI